MSFAIASIVNAVAQAIPDREALVFGERRFTFANLADRTERLANVLLEHGVTLHTPRSALANWECGQDTVALVMFNGNEYLESMLGAFKARAAPVNINYRYVAEEMAYVFRDAGIQALIYQRRFAPVLREVLASHGPLKLIIEVDDGSDATALAGALSYEQAIAGASPQPGRRDHDPDDLYILYTGGTTGMPKGVLWRQADSVVAQLAGRDRDGALLTSLDAFASRARESRGHRILPTSPFMHGAGSYVSFNAWNSGGTVIVQSVVDRLDAANVLQTIETERANLLLLIGDAFGAPLVEAARAGGFDLGSVKAIFNTGALLSDPVKDGLLEVMPGARIVDGLGSSETGPQATAVSRAGKTVRTGEFRGTPESAVMNEELTDELAPGHEGLGWLAKRGTVPLGYLGDEEKTRATFPVINGVRHVLSGDRVKLLADGTVQFHGRESFTINSGGEKIFVEEVELALKAHAEVHDALVTSRPSARWGNEVVAVVQMREGCEADRASLLAEAGKHIARYKLPKAFVFVDLIRRGDNGKADYRWAREVGQEAT